IENAEPVSAGVSGGGIRFQQILRQAIAVAITVPGTFTPQLEFGAVRYLTDNYQPLLELAVRNTGNVHLRLRGTLSVQVPTGEPVVQIPVELDTIYAGTATTITVSLPKPLTPGEYRVRAVFEDPDRGFVTTTAAPLPFFVVATQNPVEYEGTYPLPEAQLDRFCFKLVVGYPSEEEEDAILTRHDAGLDPHDLASAGVRAVAGPGDLAAARAEVAAIRVEPQ
ncbi:MAG: hypothetical protein C4345_06810, partial [Chloroflexota bacterium]